VDGDKVVGDVFQFGADAKLAAVVSVARHAGKNRFAFFVGGRIAAGIDNRILGRRLRARAADGAIQHDDADFGKALACVFFELERQRTDFDNDGAAFCTGGDAARAKQRCLKRRIGRQRGNDDLLAGRHVGGGGSGNTAELFQRLDGGRRNVKTGHFKTGRRQMLGERSAHNP
jgi:hypothetical protein